MMLPHVMVVKMDYLEIFLELDYPFRLDVRIHTPNVHINLHPPYG
jgi:hypothetical protein